MWFGEEIISRGIIVCVLIEQDIDTCLLWGYYIDSLILKLANGYLYKSC